MRQPEMVLVRHRENGAMAREGPRRWFPLRKPGGAVRTVANT
jgi:hypothetical protein